MNDLTVNNVTLIREIEEAAADAVPAAVVERLGGWRLRFNHGVKRRPNSVLASADDGTLPLEERLGRVETFYQSHGMAARFQLSPASRPGNLDAFLEVKGYSLVPEPVCVQIVELAQVPHTQNSVVTLLTEPTTAWLALYSVIEGLGGVQLEAFSEMLDKLPGEAIFALASDREGSPAATGVGVAHKGWLGLFNIATHTQARRQGLGSAVVTALCAWGREQGLRNAYLQVAGNNTDAQALYERLGFKTLYHYHYCEQNV